MAKVIILGSSRSDGDTAKVAGKLMQLSNWDIIDLNDYVFSYYDYHHQNKSDDYLGLIQRIISTYDTIILATPVYWYAMSGIMKVFLDRITDLLDYEKELGRKLRGKKMAVVSSSVGDHLQEHFWLPFRETAKYLGMDFITGMHTIAGQDYDKQLEQLYSEVAGI